MAREWAERTDASLLLGPHLGARRDGWGLSVGAVEPTPHTRTPGDRQVVVGAVLFGIGLVAAIVTLVPFLIDSDRFPVGVYALTVLAPIGLGLALTGMVRGSRARRRPSRPR